MRQLKQLRASSAHPGSTSQGSISQSVLALSRINDLNRQMVSRQIPQSMSAADLFDQSSQSSKRLFRRGESVDRYQAFIDSEKGKFQTKSPESLNVKKRMLKSATDIGRKSSQKKNNLNFNRSGELKPINQFEKVYAQEIENRLPKLQFSSQKQTKQKTEQVDKQKIKILKVLSKELKAKSRSKQKTKKDDSFEKRIADKVYQKLVASRQRPRQEPQSISNTGNNLCIPGFYTNHIENLTINAAGALPISMINNAQSDKQESSPPNVGNINMDLVSTPAVLSQYSPKDDSSFGGVSKQHIRRQPRQLGRKASQSSVKAKDPKMDSLDPEDAEILSKLKADLKEMRSNSRTSQKKTQEIKPSDKLTMLQSRMKKLRDTSQELNEKSRPASPKTTFKVKDSVKNKEPQKFMNPQLPYQSKIPIKRKVQAYQKYNTQKPKEIEQPTDLSIPVVHSNLKLELSSFSSDINARDFSDAKMMIQIKGLCEDDHTHEKTVIKQAEELLVSPALKTQKSLPLQDVSSEGHDEDGILQFEARSFSSSEEEDLSQFQNLEKSQDSKIELRRNPQVVVKDSKIEKFINYLSKFQFKTQQLQNRQRMLKIGQIMDIQSEIQDQTIEKPEIFEKKLEIFEKVEKNCRKFQPNPNYMLNLTASYKQLNERKQLFDIYSEYPKTTAQKLEKFMNAVVTFDPKHSCLGTRRAIKLILFQPISTRQDFKKSIQVFDLNFQNLVSKNRICTKKSRDLINEDDEETQKRMNRFQFPKEIIEDDYARQSLQTIKDPIQEKIVWQNIHNDAKTSLKRGVKKLYSPKFAYKHIYQDKEVSDAEVLKKFSVYADLRWKNQINTVAVITLINTKYLDNIVENISLFDIKTKTHLFDIYNDFDWKMIEYSDLVFQQKKKSGNFHKAQVKTINQILSPQPQETHFSNLDIGEIQINFGNKLRPKDDVNIQFKLKVGLCLRQMAKFINKSIFDENFSTITYQYQEKARKIQEKQKTQQEMHLENLPRGFNQYQAYQVTNKSHRYLVEVIFNISPGSHFRLHDQDMDYVFRVRTKNLHKILQKGQIQRRDDLLRRQKKICGQFCAIDEIQFKQPRRQFSNTFEQIQNYRIQHDLFNFHQDRVHSYQGGEYDQGNFILNYKRQDALNQYGADYCNFFIHSNLQDLVLNVKDSMNLFYNRIETAIDEDDQRLNILSHSFGFKSKMIISHKDSTSIFEIFLPILVHKGKRKIAALARQKKSPRFQQQKTDAIYKLMMDEGVETDESIKDIGMDDIMSENSQNKKQTPGTVSTYKKSVLSQIPLGDSALAHYQKLRVQREKNQKQTKKLHKCMTECKSKVFKVEDQENIIQDFNFRYKKGQTQQSQNVVNDVVKQVLDDYSQQVQEQKEILDKIKVSKVNFLTRIKPESKGLANFEFNELRRKELEMQHKNDSLLKNLAKIYNYDPNYQSPIISPKASPVSMKSKSMTMRSVERSNWNLKEAILEGNSFLNQVKQESKRHKSVFLSWGQIPKLDKNDDSDLELENELEIFEVTKKRRKRFEERMQKKQIKWNQLQQSQKEDEFKNLIKCSKVYYNKVQKNDQKALQSPNAKYFNIINKIQLKLLEIKMGHIDKDQQLNHHTLDEKQSVERDIKKLEIGFGQRKSSVITQESIDQVNQNFEKMSNARTQYFISKMFQAVATKNELRMEEILKRFTLSGKDGEKKMVDSCGNSLVTLAVINQDYQMVSLLLSRGLNPNTQNVDGNTALHYAVNNGQSKIVDVLISHGADEKIMNNMGMTPWEI